MFGRQSHRDAINADRSEQERRAAEEVERALAGLSDTPARSEVEAVLQAQRREYVAFARRNASRLDQIYAQLAKFVRQVLIVGLLFVVAQVTFGFLIFDLFNGQQSGRRFAVKVTCAAESAIAEQGRQVIEGSSMLLPPAQERALERLGFPPFKVRQLQSAKQANSYVGGIAKAIDKAVGHRGDGLVRKNGTLDCVRFEHEASLDR